MLIPIIEHQYRHFVVPNEVDPSKLIVTLGQLFGSEVTREYNASTGKYHFTILPNTELEIGLTYVDSSRVRFPTPPEQLTIEKV